MCEAEPFPEVWEGLLISDGCDMQADRLLSESTLDLSADEEVPADWTELDVFVVDLVCRPGST